MYIFVVNLLGIKKYIFLNNTYSAYVFYYIKSRTFHTRHCVDLSVDFLFYFIFPGEKQDDKRKKKKQNNHDEEKSIFIRPSNINCVILLNTLRFQQLVRVLHGGWARFFFPNSLTIWKYVSCTCNVEFKVTRRQLLLLYRRL